jgi:hypothetical protein
MKRKGNAEKEAFRRTKEWKQFRIHLIDERGQYCECCGKKTKVLQCHHADEKNYQDLNPDNFFLLCALCHKCVSDLEHIKPENRARLRSKEWNDMFGRFLKNY